MLVVPFEYKTLKLPTPFNVNFSPDLMVMLVDLVAVLIIESAVDATSLCAPRDYLFVNSAHLPFKSV